jgi:hypothetical protein
MATDLSMLIDSLFYAWIPYTKIGKADGATTTRQDPRQEKQIKEEEAQLPEHNGKREDDKLLE